MLLSVILESAGCTINQKDGYMRYMAVRTKLTYVICNSMISWATGSFKTNQSHVSFFARSFWLLFNRKKKLIKMNLKRL